METSYVMEIDGAYRITGSRVSLDSVVYDFLSDLSPESIAAWHGFAAGGRRLRCGERDNR
jgi:hypothetical protein